MTTILGVRFKLQLLLICLACFVSAPAYAQSGQVTHTVQPGENLFRIALRYNLTWDVLARANGIFNPNLIFPGQVLRIP